MLIGLHKQFLSSQREINILIAINATARSLDIPGTNLIINFDMPKPGIDYIYRTGRGDKLKLTIASVKSTKQNLMASILSTF